jgi:flagellar biosynthesis/type III secretory pathway protein FliH
VGKAVGKAEGIAEGKAVGKAEGMEEGIAVGKALGKAEGIDEGKAEGKAEGMQEGTVAGMRAQQITTAVELRRLGFDEAKIAELLSIDVEELKKFEI